MKTLTNPASNLLRGLSISVVGNLFRGLMLSPAPYGCFFLAPFSQTSALTTSNYRTSFFARPFTSWLLSSPVGDIHQRGNR